jgi:hypothetical protein
LKSALTVLRSHRLRGIWELILKKDGGWHYSYLGGVEGVLRKIRCSGHQEIFGNGDIGDSQIIAAIREGHDFFGHGIKFCFEEPLVLNKLTPIDYMPESFKNKNTL